ncbi:unnamed protein product [Orchesella dallaii]|uniref:Uncharacterized protein n=1 Tax=Orchesella dallaii TaxID=48710 RepID=A0ABP1S8P5_9HEXA
MCERIFVTVFQSGSKTMTDELAPVIFIVFTCLGVVVLLFCWVATCVSLLFGPTYHQRREARLGSISYLGSGSLIKIRKSSSFSSGIIDPLANGRPRSLQLSHSVPNIVEMPPTPPHTTPLVEASVSTKGPPEYEPPPTYIQCVRSVRFANVLLILYCSGTNVQFFEEENFKGKIYEANSSTDCKNLPTSYQPIRGSLKTSGCMAIFMNKDCLDWGYKILSEISRLSDLTHNYRGFERRGYTINSFRECSDLERETRVHLDYYEKDYLRGKMIQYRNMCGCENLPSLESTWSSAKSYGNCFKAYKTKDCVAEPYYITGTEIRHFGISWVSVEPCHYPISCRRFQSRIFNIEPITNLLKMAGSTLKIPVANKQTFINNGQTIEEYDYEATKEITETAQLELPKEFSHLHLIDLDSSLTLNFDTNVPFIMNASAVFKVGLLKVLQARQTNVTEGLKFGIESRNLFKVKEKLRFTSCSKYEIEPYVEIVKNAEIPLRIQFKLTPETNFSGEISEIDMENFQNLGYFNLKYYNTTINNTLTAESKGKLILTYAIITGIDTASKTLPGCRNQFPKFLAKIIKIYPINDLSNFPSHTTKFAISNQQTFINNGSATQEDNYDVVNEFFEVAEFHFPSEFAQLNSIEFKNISLNDYEKSIPFLERAWTELIDIAYHNHLSLNTTVKHKKEFRIQKKLVVPPCTTYEVNSFVTMSENVEILYRVEMKITAQLGFRGMKSGEFSKYFETFEVLNGIDENDLSVSVVTTAKVKLTYVVDTEYNAISTPLLDCIESQVAAIANCTFTCSA